MVFNRNSVIFANSSILLLIIIFFNCVNFAIGAVVIYAANESSASSLQLCSSPYCSNTTTFIIQESECSNPEITMQYRFTDFGNADTQYFTITINEVRLGFCRGEDSGTVGEWYKCIDHVSLQEIVGENADSIVVELHLSADVINNPIDTNLLYAYTTLYCTQTAPLSNFVRDWHITQQPGSNIFNRIACAIPGCTAQITYNLTNDENIDGCKVPLLSFDFWQTGLHLIFVFSFCIRFLFHLLVFLKKRSLKYSKLL